MGKTGRRLVVFAKLKGEETLDFLASALPKFLKVVMVLAILAAVCYGVGWLISGWDWYFDKVFVEEGKDAAEVLAKMEESGYAPHGLAAVAGFIFLYIFLVAALVAWFAGFIIYKVVTFFTGNWRRAGEIVRDEELRKGTGG